VKKKIAKTLWLVLFLTAGIIFIGTTHAGPTLMFPAEAKWKKIQGPPQRMSSDLIRMNEAAKTKSTKGTSPAGVDTMARWIRHVNGLPELEICLKSTDPQAVQTAREFLSTLGMSITYVSITYGRIYGTLDLGRLDEIQHTPYLATVHPNYLPICRYGSVDSEGDAAMDTQTIRDTYGIDGSGVTLGIISDSFDARASGDVATSITNGDLPGLGNPNGYVTPVVVLEDDPDGEDEGRAMSEIIHDVAPGAILVFHAAFLGGQAGLADHKDPG